MTRELYHIDNLTDLQKVQERAGYITVGDKRNAPEDVVVHYHKIGAPCTDECEKIAGKK